jgi:hypothetical protein
VTIGGDDRERETPLYSQNAREEALHERKLGVLSLQAACLAKSRLRACREVEPMGDYSAAQVDGEVNWA